MVKYTIEGVSLAWTDNGKKMWNVWVTKNGQSNWTLRTWATDELDAYKQAKRILMKEQDNA